MLDLAFQLLVELSRRWPPIFQHSRRTVESRPNGTIELADTELADTRGKVEAKTGIHLQRWFADKRIAAL